MHGLGNDYVYIDGHQYSLSDEQLPDLARRISNRHTGVGGDGLILILPSSAADFRMRVFNPDGSEAEMCGNGIRCFAKYVYDHSLTNCPSLRIETVGGIKSLDLVTRQGKVERVRVNMERPRWTVADVPMASHLTGRRGEDEALDVPLVISGNEFLVNGISMGNPHAVIFVEQVQEVPLKEYGPLIEHHALFPQRTNVEFVQVVNRKEVIVRVWERGAGATLACGTGACASAVAAILHGMTEETVTAHLAMGDLLVEWQSREDCYMEGPCEETFSGDYPFEGL